MLTQFHIFTLKTGWLGFVSPARGHSSSVLFSRAHGCWLLPQLLPPCESVYSHPEQRLVSQVLGCIFYLLWILCMKLIQEMKTSTISSMTIHLILTTGLSLDYLIMRSPVRLAVFQSHSRSLWSWTDEFVCWACSVWRTNTGSSPPCTQVTQDPIIPFVLISTGIVIKPTAKSVIERSEIRDPHKHTLTPSHIQGTKRIWTFLFVMILALCYPHQTCILETMRT